MLILILIGIVPSMITAYLVVRSYEERAVSLRMVNVRNQCEILCNSLVAEQYFSNPGSEVINSQLNLLSNIYSGRILIVDSDFRVVHDTFDLDTGRTSVTREVITCFLRGYERGETSLTANAHKITFHRQAAHHADGVLLASVSTNEIVQGVRLLENRGVTVIAAVSPAVLIGGYVWPAFWYSRSCASPTRSRMCRTGWTERRSPCRTTPRPSLSRPPSTRCSPGEEHGCLASGVCEQRLP